MKAGTPSDEAARLEALRQYDVLDTPPEPEFDDLTILASYICQVPMAIISLTAGNREWFKSRYGVPISEVPRHLSFCVHITSTTEVTVISDTFSDPRFADNPFVWSQPHVRFYAGIPLVTPDGEPIGSFCVADTVPRDLDENQKDALRRLARQAVALLEARPVAAEELGHSRRARIEARQERQELAATKARQDAENLKASEERYRRLFETAKDGILILDATSGKVEDVNPFLCELLDYDQGYFLGKQLWEFGIFKDVTANQEAFRILLDREYIRYDDLPLKARDGRNISVEFVSNVYVSAGRKVVQCNIRDITSQKEAITEQERFFTLSLDMLCIIDFEGYFRRINPAMARLLGFSVEDLTGRSAFDFIHPDDYEPSGQAMGLIASGYPVANFVNRFRARDKTYKSILWDTAPYGEVFYAAGRDITERVLAEETVQDSKRFLQATLDALSTHIAVLDEAGEIIAVNSAWLRFAQENDGTAMSCGIGTNYLEVCNNAVGPWSTEASEMAQGIRAVMNGSQESFCLEYPCHSSHRQRWFSVCVTRFTGDGPVRLVIAHEDISDRKHTENLIRSSEAKLVKAQEIAHLGSWEMEVPAGGDLSQSRVTWSDEVFKILGYAVGEVEPSYEIFQSRVHPEDKSRVLHFVQQAARDLKPYNIEHRLLLPDGSERYVHGESEIVLDGAGKLLRMVGTIQDITEGKSSEAALRESELRYRALAEAAPDDIFIIKRSGELEYINLHASERFGALPAELIGKKQAELFPIETAAMSERATNRVFASGEPVYDETQLTYPGEEVWQGTWLVPLKDYDGTVLSVMGVARDISKQKQAEATLRASEARYRSLFESNPHPMWVFDLETLKFLAVNDAAIAHYGFSLQEFLSMTVDEIRPPEDVPALMESISSPSLNGRGQGLWRHRQKDGSIIDVDVSTHELEFEDRPARLVLAHDITARLATERAINQAKDELERRVEERTAELGQANESLRIENIQHQVTMGTLHQAVDALRQAKDEADSANAAKSAFLSRMSHELRTPLNAILGFGQILQKQDLGPLGRESVGFILKGGNHLLTLINEVLDISRLESGRLNLSLEPISLSDVIPEACALLRPLAADHDIQLDENTAHLKHDFILADRQRLKQVLINLLANAIKYNRDGGQAEVTCIAREDGWTSIAVSDTGFGISAEDMPKLFTPFERLGASATDIEGTGLGLVLSQRLVTAMGGKLSVESTVGVGTTLTLEFPQTDAPEAQLPESMDGTVRPFNAEDEQKTYTVLCIEDNPSNLRLVEVVLMSRPEIKLISSMEGLVGLERARREKPDLILLDLNLPDISGKEILDRLRQSSETREIPIVVVSADATPNQVERLMSAGARAYLTKPLNIGQFLRTLDQCLLAKPLEEVKQ